MTTIVSAILSNVNNNRSIDKYIEHGKKLLNIPINKVIYMEKYIYDTYFENSINENTKIKFIQKKDLYLYDHIDKIINFNPDTDNPDKDTLEYMFCICNKTEWVKSAIEEDIYNSEQFIWIDFGIFHIIKDEEICKKYIYDLQTKKYDNVRIASATYYQDLNDIEIYKRITWKFLGGVFGGNKNALLKFSHLMKDKCIDIINTHKTICWEINVWYLIHKENPELFSLYKCLHDIRMLSEY
jgi:hypothetical protein